MALTSTRPLRLCLQITQSHIRLLSSIASQPALKSNDSRQKQHANLLRIDTACYRKTCIRFAGHSHWQNIRHIKGAKDAEKWKKAQAINQKIKLALKTGGSDPKLNRDLQKALDDGRAANLPLASMMEYIKKVTESKDTGTTLMVEVKGVGNSLLIIECFTDSVKNTRNMLRNQLRRKGAEMLDSGRAGSMFDHKGVLYAVAAPEDSLDGAEERAIEAGAEEVECGYTDSGQECFKYICETRALHSVKRSLEDLSVTVDEARLEYLPHTLVTLNDIQITAARELLDALEGMDDVVRVYHNIQVPDS